MSNKIIQISTVFCYGDFRVYGLSQIGELFLFNHKEGKWVLEGEDTLYDTGSNRELRPIED